MAPNKDLRDAEGGGSRSESDTRDSLSERLLDRIRGARVEAEKRQSERTVKKQSRQLKRQRSKERAKEAVSEAADAVRATRPGSAASAAAQASSRGFEFAERVTRPEDDQDDDENRSVFTGLMGDPNNDGEPEALVASFAPDDDVRAVDRDNDGDADILVARSRNTADLDSLTVEAGSVEINESEATEQQNERTDTRAPSGTAMFDIGLDGDDDDDTKRFDPDSFF